MLMHTLACHGAQDTLPQQTHCAASLCLTIRPVARVVADTVTAESSNCHALRTPSQFRELMLCTQHVPSLPWMRRWNGYITYQTSGAGSWGEPADSCNPTQLYTNGGNGGFIIITATATTWRSDYYTLGSTYPQCTVAPYPDPVTCSRGPRPEVTTQQGLC